MSSIPSLQDRLNQRADAQLETEIDACFKPFLAISDVRSALYGFELVNPKTNEKLNGYGVLKALQEVARRAAQPQRRDQEIHSFLQQIENLQAQLDSLPQ